MQVDLNITLPKYQFFVDALTEVCNSDELRTRYQGQTGYSRFLKRAIGRYPDDMDLKVFQQISNEFPVDQQWQMLCISTLSRMEFYAQ